MGARKTDTGTTLVTIPFSHFCEKARWALDRAGIEYREERHLPPVSVRRAREAGGEGTVPVLFFDTATRTDSKSILKWVDERQLETQRLFPSQPALLAEVEAFADRVDRDLGIAVRRVVFAAYVAEPKSLTRLLTRAVPWLEGIVFRFNASRARRGLAERMKLDTASVAEAHRSIDAVFQDVEKLLADGRRYLFGKQLSAADVGLASLAAPLVLPPNHPGAMDQLEEVPASLRTLVESTRRRPAGEFVLRLYRDDRAV